MATVISYLRFSTPEQSKGDSTRRQTEMAERWCKEHGHTLLAHNRMVDPGLSAYHGVNVREGALAGFLKAVRDKKIAPGTILLVEELDRISRQSPERSLELFLGIVNKGVVVVTLNTGDTFERGKIDIGRLMVAVVKFCTAHDESAKKSYRLGEVWKAKRRNIDKSPMTSQVPSWLKLEDGRIVEDKVKADVVRRIFQMVLDGYGRSAITHELNRTTPSISTTRRSGHWRQSYIAKILTSRAVIGEFQPHTYIRDEHDEEKRVPVGDPVRGYYPAVVDPKTFYAVQSVIKSRRLKIGPSTQFVNLFSGLLFNAKDRSRLFVVNKSDSRQLVSSAAYHGLKGAAAGTLFPVLSFEMTPML